MANIGGGANPLSILAGGVGAALGGLLGGSVQSPFQTQIQGGISQTNQIGSGLSAFGTNQLGMLGGNEAQTQGLLGQNIAALTANPYTDSFSAAQRAGAVENSNRAYDQQNAQQISALSAAGLAQPGGASSPLAGAIGTNAMGKAGAQSAIANQYANSAIQQRYQNLQNAYNMSQGYGNNLYQYGIGGSTSGAQIQNMGTQDYLNLAQQQAAAAQAGGGMGSGIGNLIGTGLSMIK